MRANDLGTAQGPVDADALLASYVPRLALDWVADKPTELYRRVEGTLVFVDLSGFTALTERLAARGRAGAEEISEIVATTFGNLAGIAGAYGADLLKWGGDSAVLLFDGPASAARGARAAWLMAGAMGRLGRLRTSLGRVELQVSVGVHTGAFDLFLVGGLCRELVVAGPGATSTAEMEKLASAGQVVVSQGTAAHLEGAVLGEGVAHGFALRGEPRAEELPLPGLRAHAERAALLLPERVRNYLLSDDEETEHRPVAIGFVQVSGVDALIGGVGAVAALPTLDSLVRAAQEAAHEHGVTFHGTDLSADGFKIILLAGLPSLEGSDADRLLRSTLEIVQPSTVVPACEPERPGGVPPPGVAQRGVALRAGVNFGPTFVFSGLRLGRRRVYSVSGDAVNLAARVVGAARPGQVLCTDGARAALRSPFVLVPQAPFVAKGKSGPVLTFAVRREGGNPLPASHGPPTFVGRADELALLLAAAAATGAGATGAGATGGGVTGGGGRGRVVDVVGPAGIGKSRLVDEAARAWSLPTWRVPCDAFGGGRPYRALRPVARQLVGLDDDVPRDQVGPVVAATLARSAPALLSWAPLLAEVFDAHIPTSREVDELEPRFRRRQLESAFVELLGRLVPGPAAFVFEDTQWLDQASASLVQRIAEEADVRPWLVVSSHLPDARGFLGTELAGRLVVELGALEYRSCEHLLAELADYGPRDRQILVERAAGNPLFLLELARAAQASGKPETLPDALEPLLAARVDRLSPLDRRALRTAAVLGQRFETSLLAAVVDDAALVDDALWGRLSEFVGEDGGERVFAHALVRDAAYEGLSFRRRRELHARAAAAIELRARGTEPAVELLSLHWLAAERWDRAWECARLAGERAAALYANADAATHFGRALDAARHLRELPAAEVARVGELLGDVCELAGAYARARSAYDEASARVPGGADRARLLRKVGVLYERHGRYSQARRCYTRAVRRLGGDGGALAIERCELELAKAGALHRQWRLRESAAAAVVAGDVAGRAAYRRGLAHSLYLRHINSVYLNEPDDALAHQALEIFALLGDLVGQGNVLNNLGISAYYRGAWDEALEHYRASRDVRERTGDLVGAATEENNIGEILSDQGHYAEAGYCFSGAQSSWRAARYRVGEALATSNLGRLAARTGRTGEGAELLERARARFEEIHAGSFVDEADLRLLECALAEGDLEHVVTTGAIRAAHFARRPGYERLYATALRLEGTALTQWGRYQKAGPLLDESIERLRRLSEGFELAQALEARAVLARVAAQGAAGQKAAGQEAAGQGAEDQAEATELFSRLGVLRPGLVPAS